MNSIVKDVIRHIQINNKNIAYSPILYSVRVSLVQRDIHPTEFDESDDLEHQKQIFWRPHRVEKKRWGEATIDME